MDESGMLQILPLNKRYGNFNFNPFEEYAGQNQHESSPNWRASNFQKIFKTSKHVHNTNT